MSQQPPYGQDPQQQPNQPYPPYTPYSGGGYPNPYQAFPPKKDNTTRNVLLAVGLVMLLGCGGLFAFIVVSIGRVDDSFDRDFAGSENDPVAVTEGEAFSIRGFDYDEGWSVSTTPTGDVEIGPVRVTNNRSDEEADGVSLMFRLYQDNELIETVDCSGGVSIPFERSTTLDCSTLTGVDGPLAVDEIEVYDNTYYDSEYN